MRVGPGTELGGYRVEHTIGEGGMAIVYLAERRSDGRPIVLKVLREELIADEQTKSRFLREARYAQALDHPHVVRVLDSGEHDGVPFIAMQYVKGTDLYTMLEGGPLDPHTTIALLAQIADALDAAHRVGLLHRDVKPGNVLVAGGEPRRGYLTDFGLSREITSDGPGLTQPGTFVGTIAYMAPEQMLGDGPGAPVDVYALGCVLFECLTGTCPFTGPALKVMQAHIETSPPKLAKRGSAFPRALDGVIAKALAKDPRQRYATCTELVRAAATALAVEIPPAPADAPPIPAPTSVRAAAEPLALLITGGSADGTTITLDDEFLVGRAQPGPASLGGDPELSRRHAIVRRRPDGLVAIEDLGSSNGTYVNGRRIAGSEVIRAGDELALGGSLLVVVTAARPAQIRAERPVAAAPLAVRRLSLRVTFSPETGTATLQLDEASEPISLLYRAGTWRLADAVAR